MLRSRLAIHAVEELATDSDFYVPVAADHQVVDMQDFHKIGCSLIGEP